MVSQELNLLCVCEKVEKKFPNKIRNNITFFIVLFFRNMFYLFLPSPFYNTISCVKANSFSISKLLKCFVKLLSYQRDIPFFYVWQFVVAGSIKVIHKNTGIADFAFVFSVPAVINILSLEYFFTPTVVYQKIEV